MNNEKKGISLVTLVLIIISIFVAITIVINLIKENVQSNNNSKENNVQIKEKFSMEMLNKNNVGISSTIESLKEKIPTLKSLDSYVDLTTGNDINEYEADGISVKMVKNKIDTVIVLNANTEFQFNGIKIGDSKQKVIDSFYKEDIDENVYSKDNKIIGKFLYGNFTQENLENKKILDKIQYAYIGNEETGVEGYYDYVITYISMEPPYKNQYASENDNAARIEIGIQNDVVTTIAIKTN